MVPYCDQGWHTRVVLKQLVLGALLWPALGCDGDDAVKRDRPAAVPVDAPGATERLACERDAYDLLAAAAALPSRCSTDDECAVVDARIQEGQFRHVSSR